jgi:hypothetical protein
MRSKTRGRVSGLGAKNVRKTLLVPAALAVTALAAACGDDGPALTACAAVPDSGTCQVCFDTTGKKSCAGAQSCYWDEVRGICERLAA